MHTRQLALTSSEAKAPRSWVSSPRITSGAVSARCARPGKIRMSRLSPGIRTAPFKTLSICAGTSIYPASIQPWRAPAIPQISTGMSSGAPTAARWAFKTSAKPVRAAVVIPSLLRLSARMAPLLSSNHMRKLVVPQSTATNAGCAIRKFLRQR
ncbi:hypothetical protein D3C80_1594000 [compost metagenome]